MYVFIFVSENNTILVIIETLLYTSRMLTLALIVTGSLITIWLIRVICGVVGGVGVAPGWYSYPGRESYPGWNVK